MVDVSTFKDPIDVKLAMLLHFPVDVSVDVRGSDRCEFYYYAAKQLYIRELRRGFAL